MAATTVSGAVGEIRASSTLASRTIHSLTWLNGRASPLQGDGAGSTPAVSSNMGSLAQRQGTGLWNQVSRIVTDTTLQLNSFLDACSDFMKIHEIK